MKNSHWILPLSLFHICFANTTGSVLLPNGQGIAGIQIVQQSNLQSVYTDSEGNYTLLIDEATQLKANQTYFTGLKWKQNSLSFNLDQASDLRLQIFSILGNKIYDSGSQFKNIGPQEFRLPLFPNSGTQILRLLINNKSFVYHTSQINSTKIRSAQVLALSLGVQYDSLIVYDGSFKIATLPFDPFLAEQNLIVLTRLLARGLIKANSSNTVQSQLKMVDNQNQVYQYTLDSILANQENYFFVNNPWHLYDSLKTWNLTLTSTNGSISDVKTLSQIADSTQVVDLFLAFPEESSSSEVIFSSSEGLSSSSSSAQMRISEMPNSIAPFVNWVWDYRQASGKQDQVENFKNLIFYPIMQNKGYLNYCVRWQSQEPLSQTKRDDIVAMLKRQINTWTKELIGFEDWPFQEIEVNVVGWAVTDASLIQSPRANERVFDQYIENDITFPNLPLPRCPDACARPSQYANPNYSSCPGYSSSNDTHFDMSLWGTTGFQGGAGGDWGQRVSDQNILQSTSINFPHIIGHETGHGFGLPDYYEEFQIPDANFTPMQGIDRNYVGDWSKVPKMVMRAGSASELTETDKWSFRKVWSEIKKHFGL